ncbi:MAG: hypothetical protein JW729_08655 [Bacteroidales bacterium]|nr:hypothetical protein [Bacteroidales bacterium]
MENTALEKVAGIKHFTQHLHQIIQKEFISAYQAESSPYIEFAERYSESISQYSIGFKQYLKDKNSIAFLNQTVAVLDQLSHALTTSFKETEEVHFTKTLQQISETTLAFIQESSTIEESFIANFIKSTLDKQDEKRSKFIRYLYKKRKSVFRKSTKENAELISSFAFFFFEQSIAKVLKEHEQGLFLFYQQLSAFTQETWEEFKRNTTFINALNEANYTFESLNPSILEHNLEHDADQKLATISINFKLFTEQFAKAIEEAIEHFDFTSLVDLKEKELSVLEMNTTKTKHFKKLEKHALLWRKTRVVLIEDWLLDLEIFRLKYKIIPKYLDFTHQLNTDFSGPLNKEIDAFESKFDQLNGYFEKSANLKSEKDLHASLLDLKLQLKKELLDQSIPLLRNQLNSPKLIEEIDGFESLAETSFSSLSEIRRLMKNPDYLREVEADEIEVISPRDLISFEIKPAFITIFSSLKRALIAHTQNLLNQLETAPNIAIYSIESASKLFDEKKSINEVRKICSEGIDRSKSKVKEAKLLNEAFIAAETKKLRAAIDTLTASVTEITNNESALQIKIRIMRAKALNRSKEVKKQIITKVLNALPILLEKLKLLYQFMQDTSQKIAKQFALNPTTNFITTDISHFLTTASLSISQLPYIYQRLFSFEPLETFDMYIDRPKPMQELNEAYANWKQGKFAPVVLIGERGSGKTTFIRKFTQTHTSGEKVNLLDLLVENSSPETNYQKLLELVATEKNQSSDKRIIIIDGVEHLFESKINGFDYFLALFKLISDTQKEIFWIVSVHSLSWNYLDKSIHASNYFGYHIKLNNLELEELVSLIESRHNLSGYNIEFGGIQKKKTLLRSVSYETEDPQIELRKNFFQQLNKSVEGNILQAYIYWLRSAQLKENNTIFIQTDNQLDFDFVRGIPHQKLHILRSILLHNGLDKEKLAKTFRISESKGELELKQLFDDGILILKNKMYFINPLIYKQLIKHLNDINLLQ